MSNPPAGPEGPGRDPIEGRVAVVTGASSGIGAATAAHLLRAGASVALVGRRTDRLEATARAGGADPAGGGERADGGERAAVVTADVSDPLALADALDAVHDRFGRVDLVVAAAGVLSGAPFEDSVPGEWASMVEVNLNGLLATAQTFARDLLAAAADGRSADLFLVGALAGQVPFPGYAVYSALEAAVAQLSRSLRSEYGPRGVRVHNVAPGLTETEFGGGITDERTAQLWRAYRESVGPIGAEDVARALVFSAAQPAHVNVAELLVVPTAEDRFGAGPSAGPGGGPGPGR